MIPPEYRFVQISGGCQTPGSDDIDDQDGLPKGDPRRLRRCFPSRYALEFADWDERRILTLFGNTISQDIFGEKEEEIMDKMVMTLESTVSTLEPDVSILELDEDFGFLRPTDKTAFEHWSVHVPNHPRLDECPSLAGLKSVRRSQLIEVDRIHSLVDHMYYETKDGARHDVVAKYYFALPSHPHIVPFDRVVVNDLEDRVVGFTSVYHPGGDLGDSPPSLVKLDWLRQLTGVVDDLNLKYGVAHQDIHPRNLVLDPKTGTVRVFDFSFSAVIGDVSGRHLSIDRRAVHNHRADTVGTVFTIYELITRDYHYRTGCFDYPDVSNIMDMDQWVPHPEVTLDHDIAEFRDHLNKWLAAREVSRPATHPIDAIPRLFPKLDRFGHEWESAEAKIDRESEKPSNVFWGSMKDWEGSGLDIIEWRRVPQEKLVEGIEYLMNGKPLEGELVRVED